MTLTYRLFVNRERTRYARVWSNGVVEIAEREASWHTWGPPVTLFEEDMSVWRAELAQRD